MNKVFYSKTNYKPWVLLILSCLPLSLVFLAGLEILQTFLVDSLSLKDLLISIIFLSLSFGVITYSIYFLIKQNPRILISENGIIINKRMVPITEIKQIAVRGKGITHFLYLSYPIEASIIYLKDGSEIQIAVENYRNGQLIRKNLELIENYLQGKTNSIIIIEKEEVKPTEYLNYRTEPLINYYRSPFKSFDNYFFGLFFIFILYTFATTGFGSPGSISSWLIFLLVIALPVFFTIFNSHYFKLTTNFLVIKNIFLPGWEKVFKLNEIDYVEIDPIPNQETALKFIDRTFRIYRFRSNLMTEEMFIELVQNINKRR